MSTKNYIKTVFTFDVENLFNIARLRSANIANHIKIDGVSQESNLALTESERDLWNVSIRYPANAVYSYLMSAGKVKEGDYQYGIPDAAGSIKIQYTLYLHEDWDKNLSRGLNDLIELALVSGGLADWYKSSLNATAFNVLQEEYNKALATCKLYINRRKYPTARRHQTF